MFSHLLQGRHLILAAIFLTFLFTTSYLGVATYWKIDSPLKSTSKHAADRLLLPHLPLVTPDTACDNVDIPWIVNDRQYWDGWTPKALFLHPNKNFSTGDVQISQGMSVCIVVLLSPIPSTSLVKTLDHIGPADSIVLSAKGKQVEKMIELLQHPRHGIAYYAPVHFAHADTFVLEGRIEHRSYFWEAPIYHAYQPMPFQSENTLVVKKTDKKPPRLPVCDPKNHDHLEGSWIEKARHAESNPFDFYTMFGDAQEDHVQESRLFVADKCRMQYISVGQMAQCLHNKTVHVWGDDNVARNLKAFSSGGQWCSSRRSDANSTCDCPPAARGVKDRDLRLENAGTAFTLNKTWNVDTHVYFNHIGSIVETNYKLQIKEQAEQLPRADIVLVAVGNKDIAENMVSPSQFERRVDDLLSYLTDVVYPRQTLIVRTAQFFCCHDVSVTSWNSGRSAAFSHLIRKAVEKLHDPRVLLWDVHKLGTPGNVCLSRGAVQTRRDVINIENNLLGNVICKTTTRTQQTTTASM